MSLFKNTLSARLTLYYGCAFLALLGLSFLLVYLSVNTIMNSRMDEDLDEDFSELNAIYSSENLSGLRREIEKELAGTDIETGFIRVLGADAEVIYSSGMAHWFGIADEIDVVKKFISSGQDTHLFEASFKDQEEPTRMIIGRMAPDIYIHIGESSEEKTELMETLLQVFIGMFLIGIPLASLLSWFFARRATRDIELISKATLLLEQGNLETRVKVGSSSDEVNNLASTFNSMAGRIQELITEMQEMIDNLAHDLRSPITRIRARSETALAGDDQDSATLAANTIEECDRLIRMINNSLDFAELEAGVAKKEYKPINICELVVEACELYEAAAEEKDIALSFSGAGSCMISGNQQNLQRMFANLLDNALKYSDSGSAIKVTNSSDQGQLLIEVRDQGIGIPAAEHRKVFQRFYRCDQSRGEEGCGLGLSFSRAVAEAHGGQLTLSSSPNMGSTFTIVLPLSD